MPKEVSAEAVELYSRGLKRQFYTHTIFARWCAEAFYMGLVCFASPLLSMVVLGAGDSVDAGGQPIDLTVLGVAIMVNVTVCVNLRFALECHSFSVLEAFVFALNFIGPPPHRRGARHRGRHRGGHRLRPRGAAWIGAAHHTRERRGT